MLVGGARRSDRLRSIGLTGLPWSDRKMYGGPSGVLGRTIRFTRIQLTGPSAELRRTVRFALFHQGPVRNGSVYFPPSAGGPSASPDRTVRGACSNYQTEATRSGRQRLCNASESVIFAPYP